MKEEDGSAPSGCDWRDAVPSRRRSPSPPASRRSMRALGWRISARRIVELFGPSSCGKTTLALQMRRPCPEGRARRPRGSTPSIPSIRRTPHDWACDMERVPLAQPDSAEQAPRNRAHAGRLRRRGTAGRGFGRGAGSAARIGSRDRGERAGPAQPRAGLGPAKTCAHAAARGTLRGISQPDALGPRPPRGEDETSAGGPPLKLYAAVRLALIPSAGRPRGVPGAEKQGRGGLSRRRATAARWRIHRKPVKWGSQRTSYKKTRKIRAFCAYFSLHRPFLPL